MTDADDPGDRTEWARAVMDGYEGVAAAYEADRDPSAEVPLVERFAADLNPGDRVLDAGCGGGRAVLETLGPDFETVGLDLSAEQLALARDRAPSAALVRGEMGRLPLTGQAVDAVTSLHAVIHVPRDHHAAVFAEFARVCRPGGRLLVTVGVGPWEGRNDDWLDSDSAMRWSFHGEERSRELLREAGFSVDEATVVGDELGGGEWLFVRATLAD